ncbi:MAG TPA: peroxiredoxin [Nocardioidaceae bacterium]|nr:peroxiredoxin [Nocardioidaceae bacterium]
MSIDVGQQAPDFTLKDQHGQDVTLSSYRGDKAVMVMFYPFAFSRICTSELCDVRDHLSSFVNDNVLLLAVSCDPMFALRAYSEHDNLTYPLLSDFWPHGEVARAYGVFNESAGCAIRGSYLVDREGVVVWKVENAIPEARNLDEQRKIIADLVP